MVSRPAFAALGFAVLAEFERVFYHVVDDEIRVIAVAHHFGAEGHQRISENSYSVNGRPKRLFDRETMHALFANGWRVLSLEETTISRHLLPMTVWEIALERAA